MSNSIRTSDEILKEALFQLTNELVLAPMVNRDFEAKFEGAPKKGSTIRLARPIKGQVRTGKTQVIQDTEEGNTSLAVATQIGADLDMSSVDMTLSIDKFGERYLKPQMIQLANQIDLAIHAELYQHCPNWVGSPGNNINAFSDYALGPQRLDELSVPHSKDWMGVLSPADYWGAVGSQTSLSGDAPVRSALQKSNLGRFANTDTYMTQNVKAHTVGTWGTTPTTTSGITQSATYSSVMTSTYLSQSLTVTGLHLSTGTVKKGDVFTISGVYAVNSVTGDALDFLRQFTHVGDDATADASGAATLTISPAIITAGPYKTCSAAALTAATITYKGTAGSSYRQNLVMHPDAVTLAVPALFKPPGAVKCSVQTHEGISMRLIEGYDITNDDALWRFDILFGVLAHQPWLATRLSGI